MRNYQCAFISMMLVSMNAYCFDPKDHCERVEVPSKEHADFAKKAFSYAILSNNEYEDERYKFQLPGNWTWVASCPSGNNSCPSGKNGLKFSIYRDGMSQKHVVAIRGTANARGWISNLTWPVQYRDIDEKAKGFVDGNGINIRENYVVTGHSLGGGISIFLSMKYGVTAYGFNSSPRYGWLIRKPYRNVHGIRYVAYESGDPTRIAGNLLFPWRWNFISEDFSKIYFQKYSFTDEQNHFSVPLTWGLIRVAAQAGDHDAGVIYEQICKRH